MKIFRALLLALCLWPAKAPALPQDLCDPAFMNPALLQTLSPAEQRCLWRRLKEISRHSKASEYFLIEINDYGAAFDARLLCQQSGLALGKRTHSLKVLASSSYHPSPEDLAAWNSKMDGLKSLKEERIVVPAMEAFEGRTLFRCEHRCLGVTRYSEWLDSATGLVLRSAGFDEKGHLFFAKLYSHASTGQALGTQPVLGDSQAKALAALLDAKRLEDMAQVPVYLGNLGPALDEILKK